ncbi:MAG: glycosyltransferase family 9 protein [Verrucomicrobiota bacterium]
MKFLLIRNDNIGDLACTTPLLEVLRMAFPEATIDFLGNEYNIDLVRHDPRISRLWSYGKAKHVHGLWKKIKAWIHKVIVLLQLRQQHYDSVIIAVPVFNKRTTGLACWIKPRTIYGAPSQQHRLPKNYHPVVIDPNAPHVLQVLTYARAFDINFPAPEAMSLFLSEEEKKSLVAERALVPENSSLPIIGLQISARRPKQRWTFEQWSQLITALLPHARLRLLWSPGSAGALQHPGDDELAEQLAAVFPALLANPTTNLRHLMVAFSACDLIVGSDGGAMHIAAALDVATVTLFGDIDPTVWRPYSKKGIAISSPTDTLSDLDPIVVAKKVIEII